MKTQKRLVPNRTLKLAFAKQQATREEQRFFRLEISAEAANAPWYQSWMFKAYKYISDYGFSLLRPLLFLLLTLVVCYSIYGFLAGLSLCLPWNEDCQINFDLLKFSILQIVPALGLDKWADSLREQLYISGSASVLFTAIVILHRSLSLLALFLIALALRNLFKMK